MESYSVTNQGNKVFRGTLSACLRAVATYIGGIEGRQNVTIMQAMESPYRIVRA